MPDKPMSETITLDALNQLSSSAFINRLADIFEHSPWVAKAVVGQRPFASVEELHTQMKRVVKNSLQTEKLTLLCAHPQLAGKEAQQGGLTDSSTSEQASAGLNALNQHELELVAELNQAYQAKFGFPFIIAVRNYSKREIFTAWRDRLAHSAAVEFEEALSQVYDIARIRLEQKVVSH